MIQRDYEYVSGDPYPHQITERRYLFGFKVSERLIVGSGYGWYEMPSLHYVFPGASVYDEILRQERYAKEAT